MRHVLLINHDKIPHYRVPVFNHLSEYLKKNGFVLTVISGGIQDGDPHAIEFDYTEVPLSALSIGKIVLKMAPDIVIFWVRLRDLYLFPILILTKMLGKKAVYWGHGCDLYDMRRMGVIKRIGNIVEHWFCDAIILYGEHLKKHIINKFHHKVFIANNTLKFDSNEAGISNGESVLSKYGIRTRRNIICMGRMQRRKRLEDLFRALELINSGDIGLILVGPDTDGVLQEVHGDNIYKLGPIYGNERFELLSAADVFCLPGAVGLSIVDAFHCGLPMVTEEGQESPEIMYLKDGVNGFIVPEGDVQELATKLKLLLEDETIRGAFSRAAREEIVTTGHIDVMCNGFCEALRYVCYGRQNDL